jgi:L-lactate dehydrogenase complex protein LldG
VSARDQILTRIRVAIAGSRADRGDSYARVPRDYRQSDSLDPAARLHLFRERLHDYGVHTACCNLGGEPDAIAQFLRDRAKPSLLVPDGFPREWLPQGFDFCSPEGLDYHAIDRSQGVITQSTAAIALTGTIVLRDLAPGQGPRALSLIPDYHLCVVNAGQLVETVPEAIRAIDSAGVRTLTTISGPSATSDIEMIRIRGVHGPRTLDVLIRGPF